MKFRLTAVVLLSICLSNAFADEGMWLLGNLKKNKQTERVMKDLGLQIPVNKLIVATVGTANGSMTLKKIFSSDAPSNCAASIKESGTLF